MIMVLRVSVSLAAAAQATGVWPRTLRHAVCAGVVNPSQTARPPVSLAIRAFAITPSIIGL
jgi:hypothetical protein